jgi:hypothetical protein
VGVASICHAGGGASRRKNGKPRSAARLVIVASAGAVVVSWRFVIFRPPGLIDDAGSGSVAADAGPFSFSFGVKLRPP